MEQYTVTGMSCAACVARVEKAVSKVEGVTSCSVSLLTNSMGVEGTAKSSDIINAVTAAGYGAVLKGGSSEGEKIPSEDSLKDTETPKMVKRLIVSIAFLLVLMYFSMGHMMWGWPLPAFYNDNHIAMGLTQMLLTVIIMVINQKFFINGFKGLANRSPNMDSLVALGSGASFVWSMYVLFAMTRAQADGNIAAVEDYMMQFYFESAAMILTLITLGKMLESRSKGKTTNALKSLMRLAPQSAVIIKDEKEMVVPIEKVEIGNIFVVKPGESIPVDGIVIDGNSAVNESALTGESIPVDKEEGSHVSAGTINQSGYLKCRAEAVGRDTALSKIIKMVSDAAATKAPIARIADKVSGIFVPAAISIAAVTFIIWMLVTAGDVGYSLARAISVLVISCPCALGLATPVAIMVGNGMGAKNGILFKTSAALEETGRVKIVALDKTGTITKGEPTVTDIIAADGISNDELLKLAYALEAKSEHPLAKAVVKAAEKAGITALDTEAFKAVAGNGLEAVYNGKILAGGNYNFISKKADVHDKLKNEAEKLASDGKTPLYFMYDGKMLGMIAVADVIKEDSQEAISQLRNMGIHVVMLTGDNEGTANAIGKLAGVDEVVAGVLPDGKEKIIRELKKHGKTAMVGDGINDAPALTLADIGVAIGAGTDVAIDAADVVLMNSNLTDVAAAIRLSRQTLRNIHQNLFWAFCYNVIGIPLAAGCFIYAFGWTLNPMFGAAAMSLSSFCVVSNALRLNLFKLYETKRDKKIKNMVTGKLLEHYTEVKDVSAGEDKPEADVVLKVEGMMCPHCEATVKKAIEALDGVNEATADHVSGTVKIVGGKDIPEDVYKSVIENEDYEFIGMEKCNDA